MGIDVHLPLVRGVPLVHLNNMFPVGVEGDLPDIACPGNLSAHCLVVSQQLGLAFANPLNPT